MRTVDRARLAAVRDDARNRLSRGGGGRWELPGGGLLEIERPARFLVVARDDEAGTLRRLTGGVASRLVMPSDPKLAPGIGPVVAAVLDAVADVGRPWLIGLRVDELDDASCDARLLLGDRSAGPVEAQLRSALGDVEVRGQRWRLRVRAGRPSLASALVDACDGADAEPIDMELAPIFRAPDGRLHPLVLDDLRRALHRTLVALLAALHASEPEGAPPRLGVARLDEAAHRADAMLCAAGAAFQVLVQLTPANLEAAWQRLLETDFSEEPRFVYRPLDHDPVALKRQVFAAPVDAIEDPFVAELLRDKQEELDRTLSMMRDRGETFLHESEQIFGRPDAPLCEVAERILALDDASAPDGGPELDTAGIVERAHEHMLSYRAQDPLFPSELEVRDDIAAGMMVSRGRLLIRADLTTTEPRLFALLEHEVGTHVGTWFNGSAQPLMLFGAGLAGCEALQEGLAVLAEHLAGGLDPGRMRVLAARVIAADSVADGASFLEIFHGLTRSHGLPRRSAFQITVRAMRGGGLTKDLAYLRGLLDVVEHLRAGGALEPLYVGKIALAHLPLVEMLLERGAIGPPRVLPRILADRDGRARLAALREYDSATDAVVAMARGAA